MTWNEYLFFAIPALCCWIAGGVLVYTCKKRLVSEVFVMTGIGIFTAFIIGLWIGLERPPLRTMGETRLWYSFFLATIGYVTYKYFKYKWFLSFSCLVAAVFLCINIFKPEIHSTNLMPALQSIWFVPHVTVYILSYAMLGAATIASFIQLFNIKRGNSDPDLYAATDRIVYAGFGFLMIGMLIGAIWANEAWGRFWSWDPKETWAFITATAYLLYIHLRLQKLYPKFTLWMLPVAFLLLMITWIGVNYLPSAQGSVHVY